MNNNVDYGLECLRKSLTTDKMSEEETIAANAMLKTIMAIA